MTWVSTSATFLVVGVSIVVGYVPMLVRADRRDRS